MRSPGHLGRAGHRLLRWARALLGALWSALRGAGWGLERLGARLRRRRGRALYVDRRLRLTAAGIRVRRYYWPFGTRRFPYESIRGYRARSLSMRGGQYRIHGIDLRGRWYPHDPRRPDKELAIELDVGQRVVPVLTPARPDDVLQLLRERVDPDGAGRH